MQEAIHYPNLKTVLMVEDILKEAELCLSREEIKRRLPKKIMHQTLNVILKYLEDSNKILDGHKGILWIYNPSPKLKRLIEEGTEWKKGESWEEFLEKIALQKNKQ